VEATLNTDIKTESYNQLITSILNSMSRRIVHVLNIILCSGGDFCWRLGGRASKARVSSRRRSADGVECVEGVPSPLGRGLERVCPPHEIFRFLSSKGEFWCILDVIFAVELNWNWLGHWVACTDWQALSTDWWVLSERISIDRKV